MTPWFRVKIANFSRLHCLAITKRDFRSKKTKPCIEKCPESLGVIIRSILASWIYTFILWRSPIFLTLMVCCWVSSLKNHRWIEQFLFKLCCCFCFLVCLFVLGFPHHIYLPLCSSILILCFCDKNKRKKKMKTVGDLKQFLFKFCCCFCLFVSWIDRFFDWLILQSQQNLIGYNFPTYVTLNLLRKFSQSF